MKSPSAVINLMGLFFIVLGTVWFSFIQSRCYEISPRPTLAAATKAGSFTGDVPVVKMVRSPHAKFYHDLLFWTITIVEVFTAVFYVLAGISLQRRFVLARFFVSLALWLHIALMILIIGFMKFGAIPLSNLTHNPNLLQMYFLPSHKIHNLLLVAFNGFQFYLPTGNFYLAGVVLYFYLCFFVFSRPEVKTYMTPVKKA